MLSILISWCIEFCYYFYYFLPSDRFAGGGKEGARHLPTIYLIHAGCNDSIILLLF